jgi:membrane-associated phospholipid phosphatase
MENVIALWVTRILNPLIIPSATLFLLMMHGGPYTDGLSWQGRLIIPIVVFAISFLLPGLLFLIMIRLGLIRDPEMQNRHDRILPSIITAIFFYTAYHILVRWQVHPVYSYYMLSATFLVVICLAVTYFWKISLHTSAMGAMTGTFVGMSFLSSTPYEIMIVLSIILSGLVAFARLRLLAHSPAQVYVGFLVGFAVIAGLFLFQTF